MLPKMTIEQFRKIKERLIKESEKIQEEVDNTDTNNLTPAEEEALYKKILSQYTAIQNELFNYDLSDIPFEEWKDIIILSMDELDLSHCRANLDFHIIEEFGFPNGVNLKNCEIRNLKYISAPLEEKYFDSKVIAENPQLFLSNLFNDDFKRKFARKELTIEDLYSLNYNQIKELEEKKCYQNIINQPACTSVMLQELGITTATQIHFQDQDLFKDIGFYITRSNYSWADQTPILFIKQCSNIDEIRDGIYKMISDDIKEGEVNGFKNELSSKFKEKYPDLYLNNPNIPEEVAKRYYSRKLTLDDLINYGKYLGDINLIPFSDIEIRFTYIINKLGYNYQRLAIDYPNELKTVLNLLKENHSLRYKIESNLSGAYNISNATIPTEEVKEIFLNCIFESVYGNDFEFTKAEDKTIYEGTFYPDWIKELGYYASVARNCRSYDFIPFLTKSTEIENENLKNIFNVLGLENIRRFDKENLYFYADVLETLSTITLTDLTPVTSYEEFQDKLVEIVTNYKPASAYTPNVLTNELRNIYGPFRKKYSELFIPTDAPEELKKVFYEGNLSLQLIMKNPSWIPYISHLSPKKLGLNLPIEIINSRIKSPQSPQPYTLSEYYLEYGTVEGLLKFLTSYNQISELLNEGISGNIFDINAQNSQELEKNMRTAIRRGILSKGLRYTENMPSEFKEENPDLFISPDAPAALKSSFYRRYLTLHTLNPEYIDYLKNINFKLIKDLPEAINVLGPDLKVTQITFKDLYIDKFGLESFLRFLFPYTLMINHLSNEIVDKKDGTKEELEAELEYAISKAIIRESNVNYGDYYPEHFKAKYPSLFISSEAPDELKEKFYSKKLTLDDLKVHPEWISYLTNVNFNLIVNFPCIILVVGKEKEGFNPVQKSSFNDIYVKLYGKEAFLKYVSQYGSICSQFRKSVVRLPVDSKEELEYQLDAEIYKIIIKENYTYSEDYPEHFKERFSDIFLPSDAPSELKEKFYNRKLTVSFLDKNPEYYQYLKNLNLVAALAGSKFELLADDRYTSISQVIPKILEKISQDKLLELLTLYGRYLTDSRVNIKAFEGPDFETVKKQIEKEIIEGIKKGNVLYYMDAPAFIKEELPDYFLDPQAPEELKQFYYRYNCFNNFDFHQIKKNEEAWLPFLKGKSLMVPINRCTNNFTTKNSYTKFVTLFGNDTALKLGLKRTEVVENMLNANKVDIMYEWYLKTGKKFVPDTVIMQNFSLDEADKFLSHGKEWSSLMRNKRFATHIEGREAMLKLAYVFGIFDGDSQGSKKLDSLLNDIPRKLSETDFYNLVEMESAINKNSRRSNYLGKEAYEQLEATMASEGLSIEEFSIIRTFYHENEDGTFSLTINAQNYPKTRELLRQYMEANNVSTLVTPNKAHTMFGSFKMMYDKGFREFLLNNLEFFQNNTEYTKYLPAIQEQFREIQVANSNRVLTAELAISFVEQNKYSHVEVGNEELSHVSGMAGYSQTDFDKLQEIYSHGKMRVVSSIPRIEGTLGEYRYEMLALTNPLAVAIGTLTDCCQELNNAAELCMEHSMVSTHGRVFVIRDQTGNFISQSWVWRNGDVLCFDNIEIPDKAFTRAQRKELSQTRKGFTEEVYEVYKQAAHELIEQDEKVYKELFESGKITKEQYEGLRLGKITVGLGYNDIAESLKRNATLDEGKLARPLAFEPPVPLARGLYTSDSTTQYILEERKDRKEYTGDTLAVHYDEVKIYDYQTFGEIQFLTLQRLEIQSGRESWMLNTDIYTTENDKKIEALASNYGLNPETIKFIISPNFAIVFDDAQEINLVDIFLNTSLSSNQREKAILQLKLAILQLQKSGKSLNTTQLELQQVKLIEEVLSINETKLDEERGISHGTN